MLRRFSATSGRSVLYSTLFGFLLTLSALCASEVLVNAAPSEIKFVGTALRQEFTVGTLSWIVSVDQLLSGPTFCPSPITVIVGSGVLPAGYVDPNVTVGSKVEVYGEVETMFWSGTDGGGVICTVFLSQGYHYFKKTTGPGETSFIVESLTADRIDIGVGDRVIFRYTIRNVGNTTGTQGVEVVIKDSRGNIVNQSRWLMTLSAGGLRDGSLEFVFTTEGTYSVTVSVPNSSKTVTVIVRSQANHPPVADFIWRPSQPKVGETVYFTDRSYDPDGSITS